MQALSLLYPYLPQNTGSVRNNDLAQCEGLILRSVIYVQLPRLIS